MVDFTITKHKASTNRVSGAFSATIEYIAEVSDRCVDTAKTVIDACPYHVGDVYPGSINVVVQTVTADFESAIEGGGGIYKVSVDFAPVAGPNEDDEDNEIAPWDRPGQITINTVRGEQLLEFDARGSACVNSIGIPFLQGLTAQRSDGMITITKNITHDGADVFSYIDTCNSDNFLSFEPYSLKCSDVRTQSMWDESWGQYWQISFSLEWKNSVAHALNYLYNGMPLTGGWSTIVLNTSLKGRKIIGGPIVDLVDEHNNPTREPLAIDADGLKLTEDKPPVFLEFFPYYQMPFNLIFNPYLN